MYQVECINDDGATIDDDIVEAYNDEYESWLSFLLL